MRRRYPTARRTGPMPAGCPTLAAPSPQTATPDAARPAEPDAASCSGCGCHPSALVCEDFDLGIGTGWMADGATARASSSPYRGTGAARFEVTRTNGTMYRAVNLGSFTSGELWVRAAVRTTAGASVTGILAFELLDVDSAGERLDHHQIALYAGPVLSLGVARFARMENAADVDEGRWYCVELQVEIGASGAVTTYVDGVRAVSFAGDTRPLGARYVLRCGPAITSPSQPAGGTVELDELVVSRTRVPCR